MNVYDSIKKRLRLYFFGKLGQLIAGLLVPVINSITAGKQTNKQKYNEKARKKNIDMNVYDSIKKRLRLYLANSDS